MAKALTFSKQKIGCRLKELNSDVFILVSTSPFIAQKEDISTKEVLKTFLCKNMQKATIRIEPGSFWILVRREV